MIALCLFINIMQPEPEQKNIDEIYKIYKELSITDFSSDHGILKSDIHINFLDKVLNGKKPLANHYQRLESGQPWLFFWTTTALSVLNYKLPFPAYILAYLKEMYNEGFQGSTYQLAHVASTYAAIGCIVNIGTEEAFKLVDKKQMKSFLMKMKKTSVDEGSDMTKWNVSPKNAFEMHQNGEFDLRALYCAVAVADILGFANDADFKEGIGDFISSCQTYEGGISCIQLAEAHAGYTYCGLSALILLGELEKINKEKLIEWYVNRQTKEGGFNGRINKRVDACYNFWVGSIGKLLGVDLISANGVRTYTLCCCQHAKGGFVDKPLKGNDLYHSCYAPSGLAYYHSELIQMHPLFNMPADKVEKAKKYFKSH